MVKPSISRQEIHLLTQHYCFLMASCVCKPRRHRLRALRGCQNVVDLERKRCSSQLQFETFAGSSWNKKFANLWQLRNEWFWAVRPTLSQPIFRSQKWNTNENCRKSSNEISKDWRRRGSKWKPVSTLSHSRKKSALNSGSSCPGSCAITQKELSEMALKKNTVRNFKLQKLNFC